MKKLFVVFILIFGVLFITKYVNAQSSGVCKFTSIKFSHINFGKDGSDPKYQKGAKIRIDVTGNDACKGGKSSIPVVSLTSIGNVYNLDIASFNEKKFTFTGSDKAEASIIIDAGEESCAGSFVGFDCNLVLSYLYADDARALAYHSDYEFNNADAEIFYECESSICRRFLGFDDAGESAPFGAPQVQGGILGETPKVGKIVCAYQDVSNSQGTRNICLTDKELKSNCKPGQICKECRALYDKDCAVSQDVLDKAEGSQKGILQDNGRCLAVYASKCGNQEDSLPHICTSKGCEPVKDPNAQGVYNSKSACDAVCKNPNFNSSSSQAPPSEPIAFSFDLPNLLEGKARSLGELIDYILSAVLKFALPLAVLFIIIQGLRLLVNPIVDSLGYKPVTEREVLKNIAAIAGGIAVIFIGRGFVSLIISILNLK